MRLVTWIVWSSQTMTGDVVGIGRIMTEKEKVSRFV